MAGMIFVTNDREWGTSSSVFYWVVDSLAERVDDPGLAQRLREVSQFNLGAFGLADFPAEQRNELVARIVELPAVARETLPRSSEREAFINEVQALADLVTSEL